MSSLRRKGPCNLGWKPQGNLYVLQEAVSTETAETEKYHAGEAPAGGRGGHMMKMTLNEEIEYLQSGNWYDKVRAVLPTDEYLKLGWAIGDILETLELFRSLAPEPQTNADRIRAMSDEELAEIFTRYSYEAHAKWYGPDQKNYWSMSVYALEAWLDWLQQPAEEDA